MNDSTNKAGGFFPPTQTSRLSSLERLNDKIRRMEDELQELKELRDGIDFTKLSHAADEALWKLLCKG